MESRPSSYHGTLISLEGSPEVISTQLRLLPNSPQILILPGIEQYLKFDHVDDKFIPRQFVRKIHEAAGLRKEAALQFLKCSKITNKRLVFLNGGTAGAQALCISAISRRETEGDLRRGEALFAKLVGNGVAGLDKEDDDSSVRNASNLDDSESFSDVDCDEALQDPSARAMKAADALDRQTASLQPSNILDLSPRGRPRSLSLPLYGYDPYDDTAPFAPFYIFGASYDEETKDRGKVEDVSHGPVPLSPVKEQAVMANIQMTLSPTSPNSGQIPPPSPSCIGEAYEPASPRSPMAWSMLSPMSEGMSSPPATPATPEGVEFGEARLVRVRSSYPSGPQIKRARSLDRVHVRGKRLSYHVAPPTQSPAKLGQLVSPSDDYRRHSSLGLSLAASGRGRSKSSLLEVPRPVFGRPSRTLIRRAPPSLKLHSLPRKPCYVDKGTDAMDWTQETTAEPESPKAAIFGPVLPLIEDLVIHLADESPSKVLELVIKGLKDGTYPICALPAVEATISEDQSLNDDGESLDGDEDTANLPVTPMSHRFSQFGAPEPSSSIPSPPALRTSDEYDPYAPDGEYAHISSQWAPQAVTKPAKVTVNAPEPLTPAQTPPPTAKSDADQKFRTYSIAGRRTAVCIQNGLRSVLNIYFPPSDKSYQQCHFPLLPDTDELWKPIFGEEDAEGPRKNGERTDLILAIGSQRGVSKELLSTIIGQVDRLGAKPNGVTRSGRLDIRYLIASAMQTFTAQPLANQTQDNPFTNPLLLATLIIPHLETYLLAHSTVRFLLLEYPPEHLATVLALQKLVGVEMVKVAGIIDANNPQSQPFSRRKGHKKQVSSIQGLDSLATCENLTFAKANLLLTSSATESEIATFINTIWTILMDASHFYVPAHPPRVPPPSKPPQPLASPSSPPVLSQYTSITRTTTVHHITAAMASPPLSPSVAPAPPSPPSQQQHKALPPRPPSPTPSKASARTARTAKSHLKSLRGGYARSTRSRAEDEAWDFAAGWGEDEVDGEFDAEERRLMPLFMRRAQARKPNSRKALRWLGLAS